MLSLTRFGWIIFAGIFACKGYENVGADGYKTPKTFYTSIDMGPSLRCGEGLSMRPKEGSRVSWEITRLKDDEELPFTGSNAIAGQWNIPNNNISASTAVMWFDISSTYSENSLRDERIHEYIFGKHKGHVLRFFVDSIKEQDVILAERATAAVTAVGRLEIAGQIVPVEIPVTIKSRVGLVTIQTTELFKMNMRALIPEVNGMNISNEIAQILATVPGIAVKDEVVLDFIMEMENHCAS